MVRADARPANRWPWIAVIVAVLAAAVVTIVLATRPTTTSAPVSPTDSPSTSTTSSAPGDPIQAAEPSGCLVEGRDVAMLLDTYAQAEHSRTGAVEVAAATMRWSLQSPRPVDQAAAANAILADPVNGATWEDFYDKNPTAFDLDPAEQAHLTTALGEWLILSYTPEAAVISATGAPVIDGVIEPDSRSGGTYHLVWGEGSWLIDGVTASSTIQEVHDLGTAFWGGC